jgi:hypothetical protein
MKEKTSVNTECSHCMRVLILGSDRMLMVHPKFGYLDLLNVCYWPTRHQIIFYDMLTY